MADVGSELNKVIYSTLADQPGKVIDNLATKNGFLAWLRIQDERQKKLTGGGNRISIVDGGYEFWEDLDTVANSTVGMYDDDQDISITPQEPFRQAKYAIRILAGSVNIRLIQLAKNKSKHRIWDLLQGLKNNLYTSIGNVFETQLFNDPTSGTANGFDGLGILVSSSPSTQTNVGGLNPTNLSFWRNQTQSAITSIGSAGGFQSLMQLYMNCAGGPVDQPDLGITTSNVWALIVGYLQQNAMRYDITADQGMAKLNIQNIKWQKATLIWSEACPENEFRFLNTNYLKLKVLKDGNFRMTNMVRPVDALYQAAILYVFCNTTCSSRRRQGYTTITG